MVFQVSESPGMPSHSCTCHSSKGVTRLKGGTSTKCSWPPIEKKVVDFPLGGKSGKFQKWLGKNFTLKKWPRQFAWNSFLWTKHHMQWVCARWFNSWAFYSLVRSHQQPLKGSRFTIPQVLHHLPFAWRFWVEWLLLSCRANPYHPWDDCIFSDMKWLIFMGNVYIYIYHSPMDVMGIILHPNDSIRDLTWSFIVGGHRTPTFEFGSPKFIIPKNGTFSRRIATMRIILNHLLGPNPIPFSTIVYRCWYLVAMGSQWNIPSLF